MPDPISSAVKGAAYGAAQSARVGWYTLQYVAARHLAGPMTPPGQVPKPYRARRPTPGHIQQAFFELMRRERQDIAKGVYKLPKDLRQPPNPVRLFSQARRYLEEAGAIARRAHRPGGRIEVRGQAGKDYPVYYRQNFHFQTDGWFSSESAEIYDTQVEAIFTGAADAMRRRALPFLLAEIDRIEAEGRQPRVADIACGTGRLLGDLLDNRPGIDAVAVDLSETYLAKARAHVGEGPDFIAAKAEDLPFEEGSVDILYTVYLFHELPAKVRREAAREFARVLKPGGLLVHVDSVQYGDTEMDLLLESFPRAVHEPYFDNYCQDDLNELFGEAGFRPEAEDIGFLTKVSAYRLPTA